MDVSDQLGQVSVTLAEDRLVPALKDVPDVPVPPVVVSAISAENPLHDVANRRLLSLDQQVNMIGHQTVRI